MSHFTAATLGATCTAVAKSIGRGIKYSYAKFAASSICIIFHIFLWIAVISKVKGFYWQNHAM